MPWTPAQNKLFRAAEHNPAIARSSGISHEDATRMAHEGIKRMAHGGLVHDTPDLLQELHDATHYGPGGLVEKLTPQLQKFYDLLTHVPIQPITGAKAASVLKGQDMQKASDLARQLQGATQQGARGPALKAIQEKAIRDLTGGNPDATISRGALGQAMQQPLSLTRVKTRQDLLPEKYQEKYGMAEREHDNDAEFEPDEEWVRDRENEILNDNFYNSGDTYDHRDVMTDVFHDADHYIQGFDNSQKYSTSSSDHAHAGQFLEQFMENEGLSRDRGNRYDQMRQNNTPDMWRTTQQIKSQEGMAHGLMFRDLLNGNIKSAMRNAKDLGYDTRDEDFRKLAQELPGYNSLKHYAKYNDDHLDGTHDYTDTTLFERNRDSHEESNREAFENSNWADARRDAEQAAREGGHGEYTGENAGEGELGSAEPYKYGSTQRLTSQYNPDLYTQQNVFGFSPTGLTRVSDSGHSAYRMDLDPQTLQKAYDKLMAKGDSSHYAQLIKKAIDNPGSATMASHFPEFTPFNKRQSYLGHFRGSSEGGDSPFLLEELQSDPAQTFSKMGLGKAVPPSLQDWVGQMGSAALHHAAQTGASAFHVPTAAAIDRLRGGTDYGWLYDKSIPQDVLNPIAQHYGLPINEGNFPGGGPRGDIPTRSIDLPDEVRQDILSKGVPYADGGEVDPSTTMYDEPTSMADLDTTGRFAHEALRGGLSGLLSIPHGMAGMAEWAMRGTPAIHPATQWLENALPSSEEVRAQHWFPKELPASNDSERALNHAAVESGDVAGSFAPIGPIEALKGVTGAGKMLAKVSKRGFPAHVWEDSYVIPPQVAHATGGPIRMNIRAAPSAPTVNDPIIAHLMRHTPKIGKSPAPAPMRFEKGGSVDPDELLSRLTEYLA